MKPKPNPNPSPNPSPSPSPSPSPDTDAGRGPRQVHSVLEGFHAPGMGGLWAELGCLRRAISVAHPRLATHAYSADLKSITDNPRCF